MNIYKLSIQFLLLLIVAQYSLGQTSTLVSVDVNGKLVYTADAKGNKIPDFSGVGYMNSEAAIPTIPVVKTVTSVTGDNLTNVQNAINEVAAMPLDENGFRGAILFKKGTYNVSNTLRISASGIVLMGEGNDAAGTCFIATKKAQHTLFNFAGSSATTAITATKKQIVDSYVPVGTKQVTVASGHSFVVGDKVLIHRIPNDAWIQMLEMDHLSSIDPAATDWTASGYDIYSERRVTAVNGDVITLDAPVMDLIDPIYATGEVMKYTSARIEKCGIENMRISSTYASETDENHGWDAVDFENIFNGWARNLEVYFFGYSAVNILDGAAWITVENCKMLDAKSIIDGGRRYSFNINGQRSLVQNCTTRKGRHDYVNGSRTAGPNVFYNSIATQQYNDIGPHHRWSTGILFDNINGNGRIDVQNRTVSGSGHGWAGAQILFWNCEGSRMVIQDPQGDHCNWSIGCIIPEITNVGDMTTEPLGIVESQGVHITDIPSLFTMQLNERLALKIDQSITFIQLPLKVFGDVDFDPGATASSGLDNTYTSSNKSVATIVYGKIHILGAGSTIITAFQVGDLTYKEATNVSQTLTVSKANQTIDFSLLPEKVFGDIDFNPGATSNSGLSVSYGSSNESTATIVNGKIHIVGVGASLITASQLGNENFYEATSVSQNLIVSKGDQVINFPILPVKYYGDIDFSPGATSNSGLVISYSSLNTAVATIVEGKIHIVGPGSSNIIASQAGDINYNAAPSVQQTLTVSKLDQTISFDAIPNKLVNDLDFDPGATASSGLAISYSSSNDQVATIVGTNIHIIGTGTSTITASQVGDINFNAAPDVTQTLTILKLDQTISFDALPSRLTTDIDFSPGATSSSGLPVSYTSLNTNVATIVNGNIHVLSAGTSTIVASQAGNATYYAAPDVSQILNVTSTTAIINLNSEIDYYTICPNPASNTVKISFNLSKQSNVRLIIVDLEGQVVKTMLNNESRFPGQNSCLVSIADLSNGLYFVKFNLDSFSKTVKMVVSK